MGCANCLSPKDRSGPERRSPGLHAVVITGLYGDGTVDHTFVRINDLWDRDPGMPGNAAAYLDTHDHGTQYVLPLQQFTDKYEAVAAFHNMNIRSPIHGEGRS